MSGARSGDHPDSAQGHEVGFLVLDKARARIGETPYAVTINVGRHVLIADEPEGLGGKDAGPPPFSNLVAALGACTSATLKMYADRKGWPLASLAVGLIHLRSNPGGVDRIERRLVIEGLDKRQRARLADVAERAPVTLAFKGGVTIETHLVGIPA